MRSSCRIPDGIVWIEIVLLYLLHSAGAVGLPDIQSNAETMASALQQTVI